MEKLLITLNFIALGFIIQQLYVYLRVNKIRWTDLRVMLFLICFFNNVYVFIHYAVLQPNKRSTLYVIFDFFRTFVLCGICYYYISKASGLISSTSRLLVMWGMRSTILLSIGVYMYLLIHIQLEHQQDSLCVLPEFYLSRSIPAFVWLTFLLVYFYLKKKISGPQDSSDDEGMTETKLEKANSEKRKETLRVLRNALIIVLC